MCQTPSAHVSYRSKRLSCAWWPDADTLPSIARTKEYYKEAPNAKDFRRREHEARKRERAAEHTFTAEKVKKIARAPPKPRAKKK